MLNPCILCRSKTTLFFTDTKYMKSYFTCQNCDLKFLDPEQRLSENEEHKRYLIHENNPTDSGYQDYLRPVRDALIEEFKTNKPSQPAQLLDFGAGPHSALAPLLQDLPIDYKAYDPYFKNEPGLLKSKYQKIAMTEVIEHLREPADIILKLKDLLLPSGQLLIMTQFLSPAIDFKNWHYRRDPTHIAFFSQKTMSYIKTQYAFSDLKFFGDRLAVFKL